MEYSKRLQEIKKELNVDTLVMMGSIVVQTKNKSIGTFGLNGCIAVIGENNTQVLLSHYYPLQNKDLLIQQLYNFQPCVLTIYIPKKYYKTVEGKWKVDTSSDFLQEFHPAIRTYSTHLNLSFFLKKSLPGCWIKWSDELITHS